MTPFIRKTIKSFSVIFFGSAIGLFVYAAPTVVVLILAGTLLATIGIVLAIEDDVNG